MDFDRRPLVAASDEFAVRLAPANAVACAVSKAKKQLLV
jgi:hypothetical protein